MDRLKVQTAISSWESAKDAILDLRSKLSKDSNSFYMFFCSSKYDLNELADSLDMYFGENVIACTSSGEISKEGITSGTISAVSISTDFMKFYKYPIDNLKSFDIKDATKIADEFKKNANFKNKASSKFVGLLLIDGLSMLEDKVIALLSNAFSPIEIIGGSAGDDMKFESTWVYNNKRFSKNTASILIIESEIPFTTFKSQHFEPTEKKLVITEADPANRIVYEINGELAAIEYAQILGISTKDLNPQVFAKYPVMLNIGGNWYIRSIAKMNPDFSLTFFCAIDTGLVLTLAHGKDIIDNYKDQFEKIKYELGDVSLILTFDCILRRYEIEQKHLTEQLNDVISNYDLVGFNTYGEQCSYLHVNQTLTGIAFGK